MALVYLSNVSNVIVTNVSKLLMYGKVAWNEFSLVTLHVTYDKLDRPGRKFADKIALQNAKMKQNFKKISPQCAKTNYMYCCVTAF